MLAGLTIGIIEQTQVPSLPQTPVLTPLGSIKRGGTGVGAFTNPSEGVALTNDRPVVYAMLVAFGTTSSGGGNALTSALSYGGQAMTEVASNQVNLNAQTPVVRLFRLESAPQGENTFQVSLTCGQDVNSWAAALLSSENDGGVGPNVTVGTGDASSAGETFTPTEIGSVALGAWAVQGTDSRPFTQGAGYAELLEDDTVSSGAGSASADMGWMIQSDVTSVVTPRDFNAVWSTTDGYGAAAIEILKGGGAANAGVFVPGAMTDALLWPDGDAILWPDGDKQLWS